MSQPAYFDQQLTNVSNAWFNQEADFIADKIFPEVLVKKKTFYVPKYGKDNLRVPSSSVRTGESKAKRVSLTRGADLVGPLQEHSLSDFVTQDDLDMTDSPFEAEGDAVENINSIMSLIDEKDLATMLSDTAVITQNVTKSGTSQWSDQANSNPFNDIKTGAITMKGSALKAPNTAFMSWETWMSLVDHPDFLDRIKWSKMGLMNEEDFLKLLSPYGIEKLYVGKAAENTGKEGAADGFATVWGKHFWLGYVTNRPGRKQVNGGYKFRKENSRRVTKEPKANPAGVEIVNADYYDHILLNAELFYLIKNATA